MDLVVAGVGGQGNLLISRIIGETALRSGIDVKICETFGAAQRGAAVLSLVRLGESQTPIIPFGKADVLLGLEPAEALRQSKYLSRNGLAVVSTEPVMPVEVLSGRAAYPSITQIRRLLARLASRVFMIDGQALARKAGDSRTLNLVMLGALDACDILPLKTSDLKETIASLVPDSMVEVNLRAFDLGKSYAAIESGRGSAK